VNKNNLETTLNKTKKRDKN